MSIVDTIRDLETTFIPTADEAWEESAKELIWDKVMVRKTAAGPRQLFLWLLESIGIQPEALGGQRFFESLAAAYTIIESKRSGSGLTLTNDQVRDGHILVAGQAFPLVDVVTQWVADQGASAAYWPEEKLFEFLAAGKTTQLAYDGLPYFHAAHLINLANAAMGTFKNLHTGNLTQDSWSSIYAYIRTIKGPHGKVRRLRPRGVIVPPDGLTAAQALFQAKLIGDARATTIENVVAQNGIKEIIEAPELGAEKAFYIVCEMPGSASLGPIVYTELDPYTINTYSDLTEAELGRRDEFEYHHKGRNGIGGGHPFLLHRVELPPGDVWGVQPEP